MHDLLTLSATSRRVGSSSAADVLRESVERAHHLSGLRAFLTVADRQCQEAQLTELGRRPGAGVLTGIPIAVKDNLDTADMPTTAGTPALRNSRPGRDHSAVRRLRAAGATIMGKTNLQELAFGITCNNAAFGQVRNPCDTRRIPGGSSGGSAVAVATGVVPVALGTDTGGSVGVPAAHCGVVGFRPSVGRWGSDSAVVMSSTRDTVGLLATTAADVATVDQVICGSTPRPAPRPGGVRLGVPRAGFWDDLAADVAARAGEALDRLADAGVDLVDVDLSEAHPLDELCGFPIVLYELVRELPRYLASLPGDERDLTLDDLIEGVASPDVRAALESAVDDPVSDQAYRQGLRIRDRLRACYGRAVQPSGDRRVDALVYPTVPLTAVLIGDDETTEHNGRRVPTFLTTTRNTAPGSTAGMPAISVPAGTSAAGLPIGLSLEALPGEDVALLAVAQTVESVLRRAP